MIWWGVGAAVFFVFSLVGAYRLGQIRAVRAHAVQLLKAKTQIDRLARMAKGARQ
jgi:hypothetical protein